MSEHKIEIVVANLLRAGVVLSAVTVTIGLVLALLQHEPLPDVHAFHAPTTHVIPTWEALSHAKRYAIIRLGLLMLVATPIVRVGFTLVAFALKRDGLYTLLTLFVLTVLLYSVFWAQ